jgi:hypothetical protein
LFTVVLAVALLLPGTGSVAVVVTLAVLLKAALVAVGLTIKVTVAFAPLLIVPRLQVTVVVPLQVP